MILLVQFVLFISFTILGFFIVNGELSHDYVVYISSLAGWLFSIWLTCKHKPKTYQKKIKYITAPYPKAFAVHILVVVLLAFVLISVKENLLSLLTGITFYTLTEYLFLLGWILKSGPGGLGSATQTEINRYSQDALDLEISPGPKNISPEILNNGLKSANNLIVQKLYQEVNLYTEENGQDDFFSGELNEIRNSSATNLSLLVLNTRVNDLRNINEAFKVCYDKILAGGYLVIGYNNLDDTNRLLKRKFPFGTYYFIYTFHWLFFRVFSKVNLLSGTLDWLFKGRNKVLSWVEVSGRLAYCGLEVKKENYDHGLNYVIARKTSTPSTNPNPSFYIIIKLNRVSLYGNIIKIHKLRSMYPYSEFLQKKIYELHQLGTSGKVHDDPRITPQGKIFRKYWVDELPQLLDWFRGEIKLVGIRALSQHFFGLYSQQYKDLYFKVKPGIISPIFDEETNSIVEIERIESTYLKSYLKNPTITDWRYFWITFLSIVRGVRSK